MLYDYHLVITNYTLNQSNNMKLNKSIKKIVVIV